MGAGHRDPHDVYRGSPGETEAQHQELVKFVKEFGFDMMGVFPYSAEPGTPMGRMDDQIADEVKTRVEELMLTQQQVAFKKAKKMVGQTIEVLIDRRAGRDEEDGWVGRNASQAPDIDSVTHVSGPRLHAGQMLSVKVTDYQAYDLVAETIKSKSRSLSVMKSMRVCESFVATGFCPVSGRLFSIRKHRPEGRRHQKLMVLKKCSWESIMKRKSAAPSYAVFGAVFHLLFFSWPHVHACNTDCERKWMPRSIKRWHIFSRNRSRTEAGKMDRG